MTTLDPTAYYEPEQPAEDPRYGSVKHTVVLSVLAALGVAITAVVAAILL
jgi:hypothetical protein